MRLTFKNETLRAVLADAEAHWPKGTRPTYGQKEPAPRGFWLVGDHGVYLMHNGNAEISKETPAVLCYATECDPRGDFDSWWDVKQATWGGDDGCEYLPPETIVAIIGQGLDLAVSFRATSLSISGVKPKGRRS